MFDQPFFKLLSQYKWIFTCHDCAGGRVQGQDGIGYEPGLGETPRGKCEARLNAIRTLDEVMDVIEGEGRRSVL